MANVNNKDGNYAVFKSAKQAKVAYTVAPKLAQIPLQRLACFSCVVPALEAFKERFEDTARLCSLKFIQVGSDVRRDFNLPGHIPSSRLLEQINFGNR